MEVIISDSGDEQEGMNITLILKCLVYSSIYKTMNRIEIVISSTKTIIKWNVQCVAKN